jgi:hypothetical protein
MTDDADLSAFAAEHSFGVAALRALVAELSAQAGAAWFYVFWTPERGGASGNSGRERMLVAFRSPDAALAFAQRNKLAGDERPRLRRLSLAQLVQATLRKPAIVALLLADEESEALPGRLPHGVRTERAELLRRLAEPSP